MKTQIKSTKRNVRKSFKDDFDSMLKDLGITKSFVKIMDKNWKQKQHLIV